MYKIRFYDWTTGSILKEIEDTLQDCGAIIQDFRVNYISRRNIDETAEWSFTTPELITFVRKLSKTKFWVKTNYSEILTGSLTSSFDLKILY